jgi:signal transduction histidine kinase
MAQLDLQTSVAHIRRRLFLILMQAFGAVILMTLLLLLGALTLFVNSDASGFGVNIGIGQALQGYYAGHGSWEGVQAIMVADLAGPPNSAREWGRIVLLDAAGRVVIDQGRTNSPAVGQPYNPQGGDRRAALTLGGKVIGAVVARGGAGRPFPAFLEGLIGPVMVISATSGILTLIIGFLLIRRVVTPLADVVAAAHQVAEGDLTTRVKVRGPGDLRSLSDSFNRMADALERSDRERRNLLADVAHELRTPLTIIRGRLEGIVDGVYPADEAQVAPVLEETYVLERLVEDLRVLTLAETGQLHFERLDVQLDDLASHAVDLFRAQAEDKQIDLRMSADGEIPPVKADPQRLDQVISNLVSNAIRYVPDGGHVWIAIERSQGRVRLAVRDDGPGVAEADLPHLFDRFWRAEKSRARVTGGAGLGLAIARQLIEAQGGQMAARNLPAGGLEVWFTL